MFWWILTCVVFAVMAVLVGRKRYEIRTINRRKGPRIYERVEESMMIVYAIEAAIVLCVVLFLGSYASLREFAVNAALDEEPAFLNGHFFATFMILAISAGFGRIIFAIEDEVSEAKKEELELELHILKLEKEGER